MNDEVLGQLLRDADSSAPLPQIASVSRRVRVRIRRREFSIRAASIALFISAAAVGFAVRNAMHRESLNPPTRAESVAQLKLEAAQLASEAAVHERVAQALLTARDRAVRERMWRSVASVPDPVQRIDAARDLAARILVRDADRMSPDTAGARDLYRDAAQLFPETRAGQRAAGILKEGV